VLALAAEPSLISKPVVVVLFNGGIVSFDRIADMATANPAIVEAFYPGIKGGAALANALFGVDNRWGRLPVSIYCSSYTQQVEMLDMSFTSGVGRTYMYWQGDPVTFPFGHGLSLTTFELKFTSGSSPAISFNSSSQSAEVAITVVNTGG